MVGVDCDSCLFAYVRVFSVVVGFELKHRYTQNNHVYYGSKIEQKLDMRDHRRNITTAEQSTYLFKQPE